MPNAITQYVVVTANLATANLRTLTPRRRRRIVRMARAVFAQSPDMGSLTEVWLPEVRKAIREAAPAHYRFTSAPGSVMDFWDSRRLGREKGWGSGGHGEVVAGGHYISDRRINRNVVLVDRATGRKVRFIGLHWAPIRPKLGELAVLGGRHAQNDAIGELQPELGAGGLVKVGAGDPNNHSQFLGVRINGRDVDYAGDTTPDRIFCVDSDRATAVLGPARFFTLPYGDHYRGRTATGRRRPVALAATLTITEAA